MTRTITKLRGIVAALMFLTAGASAALADQPTHYRTVKVDNVNVFYREAGPKDAPNVLLLHGWGASSFMFRDLIPILALYDTGHLALETDREAMGARIMEFLGRTLP